MTIDVATRRPLDQRVHDAAAALGAGRPVVVVDDETGEGDVVFAAEHSTSDLAAFAVRHGTGHLGVALSDDRCRHLRLPAAAYTGGAESAQRVSVDLLGRGTGISAADRGATIAALADLAREHGDFSRPGHVVPFRVDPGGVLAGRRVPEAAVDLALLAGSSGAAAFTGVVSIADPCEMAGSDELTAFAATYGLAIVTIEELVAHRRRREPAATRSTLTAMPTAHGSFDAIGYRGTRDGADHVALRAGRLEGPVPVPVHVHVDCLTGDVLRSSVCRCGADLEDALATFGRTGRGLVIYLRPAGAVRACGLFDVGTDVRAVAESAAAILADLGVDEVRLVDAPGVLAEALGRCGVVVGDGAASSTLTG